MSLCPRASAFALLALALVAIPIPAQTVPTGFVHETLVSIPAAAPDLVDFAHLGDGRVLIIDEIGTLYLYRRGAATAPVIGQIPFSNPLGSGVVESLAVDPYFASNGQIYVSVEGHSILRFTLTGDLTLAAGANLSVVAGSERTILTSAGVWGGANATVRFSFDGRLLATFPAAGSLAPTNLPGTLVKIDVLPIPPGGGAAPSLASLAPGDNPFVLSPDPVQKLVIAWGLSSGHHVGEDPLTGDLFISDGYGTARGEVNHLPYAAGVDFGYPSVIGASSIPGPPTGAVSPIVETYPFGVWATLAPLTLSAGVYRNLGGDGDWGAAYEGTLIYSFMGLIRVLTWNATTSSWGILPAVPGQPNATDWGVGISQETRRLERGPEGSLWYLAPRELCRIRTTNSIIQVVSGAGQIGARGSSFAMPIVVQVMDLSGTPSAGVPVQFTVASGTTIGSADVVADANGFASARVLATGPEPVVTARTEFGPAGGVQAQVFARGLFAQKVPGQGTVIVIISNASNGSAPVPFILAMTEDSVPLVPTPYGLLGVSILDGNGTFVIEDPLCLFNCETTIGGYGNPGKASFYTVPPWLTGTFRLQAIVVDPTVITSVENVLPSNIGFTNIVTLTF